MGQILFWQLLLLLVIVFLVVAMRDKNSYWRQLANELERQPVFSAETTRSTEAEFIRDRLPERVPKRLIALATLGTLGALLWWWLR